MAVTTKSGDTYAFVIVFNITRISIQQLFLFRKHSTSENTFHWSIVFELFCLEAKPFLGLLNWPFRFEIRFQIFALSPKVAKNGLGGKFDLRGWFWGVRRELWDSQSFDWDLTEKWFWVQWDVSQIEWLSVNFLTFSVKLNDFSVNFLKIDPFFQSFDWE